jgi:hypothetical protein
MNSYGLVIMMVLLGDNSPWINILHFVITLLDHTIAKYAVYPFVAIIFFLLFLRNKTYGEESPKIKEAEFIASKVIDILQKTALIAAVCFIGIQVVRIYLF